jgi:hypothetical protein
MPTRFFFIDARPPRRLWPLDPRVVVPTDRGTPPLTRYQPRSATTSARRPSSGSGVARVKLAVYMMSGQRVVVTVVDGESR